MARIEHVDEVCGVGKQHIKKNSFSKWIELRWCLSETFRFHTFITKGITSWIQVFCGIHGWLFTKNLDLFFANQGRSILKFQVLKGNGQEGN